MKTSKKKYRVLKVDGIREFEAESNINRYAGDSFVPLQTFLKESEKLDTPNETKGDSKR